MLNNRAKCWDEWQLLILRRITRKTGGNMKKATIIALLFLVFIVFYFTQSNIFSWFTIAGVKPNIFIILTLCIGLYAGKRVGSILGIVFGILLDIFIGKQIGISGVLLGMVGYVGGYLDKNFSKDSKITIILISITTTIIYEIINYIILILMYKMEFELIGICKIIFIESAYNAILITILYPLIRWAGYKIGSVFKGSNILTRYF